MNGVNGTIQEVLRDGDSQCLLVLIDTELAPDFPAGTVYNLRSENMGNLAGAIFFSTHPVVRWIGMVNRIRADDIIGSAINRIALIGLCG